MKFTLLEMVQEILSSMDSDEVNSISDTVESNQVALLLRSVYYDLAIDLGLPEHEGLFELDASGDSAQPTLMTIPTNVGVVRSVKYNNIDTGETRANYVDVLFKPFEDFLVDQASLRELTTGVGQMTFTSNGENFEVMYQTDKQPQFFTTYDDSTFLFDSYDSSIDTTLQKSKTMCMGVVYPTFTIADSFVPDLDITQFSLLKNRAKVRAFAELKQALNQEAAGEARLQKIRIQKRKWTAPRDPPIYSLPRYGRRDANRQIRKSLRNGS